MAKAAKATVKRAAVDPYVATLLGKITAGKHELRFRKGEKIFAQGDRADSIYFIQAGRIKIAVVSAAGKRLCWRCRDLMSVLVKGRLSTNRAG
jgi:hypothetical protein